MPPQTKNKKKPKPSKKTPPNPNYFKWTGQRRNAVILIAEGTKNYVEVAEEVRVRRETLWEWRQHPIFQAELNRLTLENEKATREGLLRIAYKAIEKKMGSITDDRSTVLEWSRFIAELQGHTKQKIELDANMKHSTANYAEMTDDELQQALKDELSKLATKGNSSGTDSN
jgi:hypothetical protein